VAVPTAARTVRSHWQDRPARCVSDGGGSSRAAMRHDAGHPAAGACLPRPAGAGRSGASAMTPPASVARDGTLSGPTVPGWLREATGETLVDLLDRAVARTPGRIAMQLRDGDDVDAWTCADLASATLQAAAVLADHGIGPGHRILTWASSDPWLVIAYFGAWRLGAAVVPLDLRMTTDVAVRIGRAAGASLVLAGPSVDPGAVARLGLSSVPVSSALVDPAGTPAPRPRSVDGGLPAVEPDMLAEILFTSGTTSDPRGVTITHRQMIHSVRAITLTSGGLRSERILSLAPLSHAYGQMVPLFGGLVTGSQTTYLPAMTPARVVHALRRDRITAMTVVPQFMELMLSQIDRAAARRGGSARLARARRFARAAHLPMAVRRLLFRDVLAGLGGSIAVLGCGGARLSEAVQLDWEAMGVRVVQGYGATECAAIAGHERDRRRAGTVGPPLAGIEVCIADDGELLARGPNATAGYWSRPEESAEMLAGGWVHTGDAAQFDEHGEVVILGRTRDRIALPNGMKVYPEDVEQALRDAGPSVIRHAVVLEAQPGQLAAILVTETQATDDAIDGAVRAANASLATHQRVRRWRRWPEADFPRTHTLKVRRNLVAEWHATHAMPGDPERSQAGGDA